MKQTPINREVKLQDPSVDEAEFYRLATAQIQEKKREDDAMILERRRQAARQARATRERTGSASESEGDDGWGEWVWISLGRAYQFIANAMAPPRVVEGEYAGEKSGVVAKKRGKRGIDPTNVVEGEIKPDQPTSSPLVIHRSPMYGAGTGATGNAGTGGIDENIKKMLPQRDPNGKKLF